MRILFANPYASDASGVTTFVRAMTGRLRARGHETSILATASRDAPAGLRNAYLALSTARRIFHGRGTFDILHAQQLHLQSLVAGLLARSLGKAVVLTVHGRSPPPAGVRGVVFRIVERTCRGLPDRLVFVAKSLRDEVGDGAVISNGIASEEVRREVGDRTALRREFGVSESFVLVFVGRVTEDKGFLMLLEALRAVKERVPAIALVAVGPLASEIRAAVESGASSLAPGRVVLTGERRDAVRILGLGDAFVLPSFHEGLPFSLLEAMAAGLPSIATRVGDVPEVVRPGETGWLVEPRNVRQLVDAIVDAARDPEGCRRRGLAAASLVARARSMEQTVDAYLDVYRSVAREPYGPNARNRSSEDPS